MPIFQGLGEIPGREQLGRALNPNDMEFITEHWAELLIALMAFAKVVVNLTPTTKDNQVFGWLDTLITAITGDKRKEDSGKL